MLGGEMEESFRVLRLEVERGEDISDAPALIRRAAYLFGGQELLCGNPKFVDELLKSLPEGTEPSLLFEWLCLSMMYANDGGTGLQSLAGTWGNSKNLYKYYIFKHLTEFAWA